MRNNHYRFRVCSFSVIFILFLFVVHGIAGDVAEFYVTSPANAQLEFEIPADPDIDRTELVLTLTVNPNPAGYSFSLNPTCGSNSVLGVPGVGPAPSSTPILCGIGNKNIAVFHDVNNSEYRIRIVHNEVPISGSETWILTIGSLPAVQVHAVISVESWDTDIVPPLQKGTDFTNIPTSIFCLDEPATVNFEDILIGTTPVKRFNIYNKHTCSGGIGPDGTADLRITSIGLINNTGQFSLPAAPSPQSLSPSAAPIGIDILYTPPTIGTLPGLPNGVDLEIRYDFFNGTSIVTNIDITHIEGTSLHRSLMIALDVSGSMHYSQDGTNHHDNVNSRIQKVANHFGEFLNLLGSFGYDYVEDLSRGRVGLIEFPGPTGFGGVTDPDFGVTDAIAPIDDINVIGSHMKDLQNRMNEISDVTGGKQTEAHNRHGRGTPMGPALQESVTELRSFIGRSINSIYLITDGEHNRGTPDLKVGAGINDFVNDELLGGTPMDNDDIQVFALGMGVSGQDDVDNSLLDGGPPGLGLGPAHGDFHGYNTDGSGPDLDALEKFFRSILVNSLGLNTALDPVGTILPGETKTHPVWVTELDRETAFVCGWETPVEDLLGFSLVAPDGEVITPEVALRHPFINYFSGPIHKMYFVQDTLLKDPGKIGTWEMVISMGHGIVKRSETYSYEMITETDLDLNVSLDKEGYKTGDDITFNATLTEKGLPVLNADVSVRILKPNQGAGNWHAENTITEKELQTVPPDSFPDPVSAKFRKTFYMRTVRAIEPPVGEVNLPVLQLKDNGTNGDFVANDGIYSGTLQGLSNGTTTEGIYSFFVQAEGITSQNNNFRREQFIQKYITVKIDPIVTGQQLVLASTGEGNIRFYEVKITPQDAHRNYVEPGLASDIHFSTSSGSLAGVIKDDLNGTYTQLIRVLPSEPDPIVTTSIAGVILPPVGVTKPFGDFIGQFNPFVAGFLFDDSLAIDDGVSFGVRLGFVWKQRYTIEAEFGVTHTHDFFGNNGAVIQTGANINVDLVYWRIIPFLTVGAGAIRFEDFSTTDNTSYVSFGGGFKLDISSRFRGRLAVRNFSISSNDFAADRTNNLQIDWGLMYSF